MPQFRYEVRDKTGKPLRGVMDAPTDAEARLRLEARGYSVSAMIPVGGQPAAAAPRAGAPPQQAYAAQVYWTNAPPKEMTVFFRGLSSYLSAGVPVHQAVSDIGNQTPNRGLRFICQRLSAYVLAGQSLASAMAQFPRAFPPHILGVVTAGEIGGFLAVVVGDLALDYELAQRASVRFGKVWVWGLWINALLTIPLIPVPPMIFSGNAATLENVMPGIIHGLQFSAKYVVIPEVMLVIGYFVLMYVMRLPTMRPTSSRLLLQVPWAGRASRDRSLASFSRILWRLQDAGIPPIQSWDAASRAAENMAVSAQLYAQTGSIRSGVRMSEAIASTNLFSSQDHRVLAIGETTGHVPDTLQRMAVYYEDAATYSLGKARWMSLRVAILVNIIVMGAAAISIAMVEPALMNWMEHQFPTE